MLLIIELALTVWLCIKFRRSGRSWLWGLLPLAAIFGAAFMYGVMLGLNGVTTINALSVIWIDILGIIAMIVGVILVRPK